MTIVHRGGSTRSATGDRFREPGLASWGRGGLVLENEEEFHDGE